MTPSNIGDRSGHYHENRASNWTAPNYFEMRLNQFNCLQSLHYLGKHQQLYTNPSMLDNVMIQWITQLICKKNSIDLDWDR